MFIPEPLLRILACLVGLNTEAYLLDVKGNLMRKWVVYTSEQDFESEFSKYVQ